MTHLLKNWQFDLFAIPITLNREGKNKAISRHGILLTLLLVGFIIWLIFSVSRELFIKKNPNTISYDSFIAVPAPMEINRDTFPIAFGLQLLDALGTNFFKDKTVYYPEVQLLIYRNVMNDDGSWTKEQEYLDIDVEDCTPAHFGVNQDVLGDVDFTMYVYCLSFVQPKLDKLILQGVEDLTTYHGLMINIVKCQNSTTCASDKEIEEKLTGAWLNLVYIQSAINPQNFSNPNQKFVSFYYTMVTPRLFKSAAIKLTHLNVIDDDGWLFETKKVHNFIKVNPPTEFFDTVPSEDGVLWSGYIDLGQMYTTYERSYTRVQTVLAQIQGSATAIILALIILLHPYSKVKFNETLINELFDVKMKKNHGRNSESGRKKSKRGKSLNDKNNKIRENEKSKTTNYLETKQKPIETIGLSDLGTDRAFMTTVQGQEDKLLRVGSPKNKLTEVKSFETILSSIDHEVDAPRAPYHQKPAQTMDMNFYSLKQNSKVKDLTND